MVTGPSPSLGQRYHEPWEDPASSGPRIIASATYITLRGRGQLSVTEEHFAAMITHSLAAPQRRLPLQESAVVMDCSPSSLAGRGQLRKLLIVEAARCSARTSHRR